MKLMVATERAHFDALSASRRAIRAGDLVTAERWMKLAERHYRLWECVRHEARQRQELRKRAAEG